MTRIFPDDRPPKRRSGISTISAARGETECFQVSLRMEGTRLNVMMAAATDLKGPKGATIPAKNIWTYYCCGPGEPWPNRFIEYLPIRWRIFSWLCFQKRIPGFPHWGYNYWRGTSKRVINPWDDTSCHRYGGGDPCIVYPPRDNGMLKQQIVIGSIRWEIIREAMEDFEYLKMTRELAESGDKEARAILAEVGRSIVPDWTTYTRDWRRMDSLRERMGDLLAKRQCGLRGHSSEHTVAQRVVT